jgi:phage major head subunit gpT-like protein
MLITSNNLDALFTGYKANFKKGFQGAASIYKTLAMIAPSSTEQEVYAWLGQFPGMREWIGPRQVNGLVVHGFSIVNAKFEDTISIPRTKIEDDQYGLFSHFFEEMGKTAAEKPDELIGKLLRDGFTRNCYDGQFFFDTDHPINQFQEGPAVSASNMQAGAGEPWFLLDCKRAMKPLIWQDRIPFDNLTKLDRDSDDNVFKNDEYIYGVRGRGNAGYGLWQLAFGSKAPLTAANYEAARNAMMTLKGEKDRPLGVVPDTLVVSPNLDGAAKRLLNNGSRTEVVDIGGGNFNAIATSNEWADTAKLIVSPWIAA